MIEKKNFILAFVAVFMLVMTVYGASALTDRPLAIDASGISLFGPITPSTDTGGFCDLGSLKNEYCAGEVHHYDLCIRTAAGGVFAPFSEVCTDYSPDVHCVANRCVKQTSILMSVLILAGIVLVLVVIWRLIKGKKIVPKIKL